MSDPYLTASELVRRREEAARALAAKRDAELAPTRARIDGIWARVLAAVERFYVVGR